jgi:LPS export ABC transporter protein LptC
LKSPFNILILSASLAIALFLSSCERKIDTIKKSEVLSLPSLTVRNSRTVYTECNSQLFGHKDKDSFIDSCKIQLILSFDLMETYNNAESPYSEFRSGIEVAFYDSHEEPVGTVFAKYAKYTDKKKLWELKDSVVVINENNDKLETEELFWDQEKDQIYTDRFIKITNEDQTVMGTGFESDHKLTRRKIKNVTATIYLKDE